VSVKSLKEKTAEREKEEIERTEVDLAKESIVNHYMQRDLDLANHNVEVRNMVRELTEPVFSKITEEHSYVLELQTVNKRFEERIILLESSQFDKRVTGDPPRTKFDDYDDKFIEFMAKLTAVELKMQ
jgi:hypothetical protein